MDKCGLMWLYYRKTLNKRLISNQQPRPKETGCVGSARYGLYVGLIPPHTKHCIIENALKGEVSNPLENEK